MSDRQAVALPIWAHEGSPWSRHIIARCLRRGWVVEGESIVYRSHRRYYCAVAILAQSFARDEIDWSDIQRLEALIRAKQQEELACKGGEEA